MSIVAVCFKTTLEFLFCEIIKYTLYLIPYTSARASHEGMEVVNGGFVPFLNQRTVQFPHVVNVG